MSTPTQKHTKSRKHVRRGAIGLRASEFIVCPKCKKVARKHTVCKHCGYYKGRQVVKMRIPKALRKKKVKEDKDENKKVKK